MVYFYKHVLAGFLAAGLLCSSVGCGVIADGHNRQGVRSVNAGDYQGGMASFQKALARDPENSDAYYNIALSLHRLGKQTKNQQYLLQAEELYNRSLDYNEENIDSYRGLAVLLAETQRSEKAFRLIRNWSNTNPTDPEAYTELARLHQEFGDTERALEQLVAAQRVQPQHARSLTALASLREKEGNVRQALADYQRAYSLDPRPELAARIASLNQSMAGSSTTFATAPSGTRTATPPRTPRY